LTDLWDPHILNFWAIADCSSAALMAASQRSVHAGRVTPVGHDHACLDRIFVTRFAVALAWRAALVEHYEFTP
jgi:hypothetical protein